MGLIVTGMHRSGTSAVASIVDRMGLGCGVRPLPTNEFNRRGYFEDLDICELNDRWLAALGGSWWAPPKVHDAQWAKIPIDILSSERQFLDSIGVRGSAWFVKDPRISLLLPLWDRLALAETPVILCVRNPLDVANSLRLREGMAESRAVALWWEYLQELLENCADRQVLVIDFDAMMRDPDQTAKAICAFASAACSVPEAFEQRMADVIDAAEQHCDGTSPRGITSEQEQDVRTLYRSLAACHGNLLQVPWGFPERPAWIRREIRKARRTWRATALIQAHDARRSTQELLERIQAANEATTAATGLVAELQQCLADREQDQARLGEQVHVLTETKDAYETQLRQLEHELVALQAVQASLQANLAERHHELDTLRESEAHNAALTAQLTAQFDAQRCVAERRQEALEGAVRTFLAEAQRSESRLNEIVGSRSYRISRRLAAPFRILAGRDRT